MKTISNLVLALMLSIGVSASPKDSGQTTEEYPENNISVEILNMSPNIEADENGMLIMSSAFIVRMNDSSNELFGSFWAQFEIEDGNTADQYKAKNWKVRDIRLAEELSPEEKKQIEIEVCDELELSNIKFLKSTIASTFDASEDVVDAGFNTEAPPIIFTNRPSSLVIIDGEPYYEELDKRYSKIGNAAAFIVKDNNADLYYMYGGGLWFTSGSIPGDWEYKEKVPNRINRVMLEHAPELHDSMNDGQDQAQIVPEIIVSTEPAELISTDGPPSFVEIEGTELFYVENTDAELFRDGGSNKLYTLFSGRWFVSDKLEGSWQYLTPEAIPTDFAKIPEDHHKSSVLVSVPGTDAANNAVKDAQIPYVTKKDIDTRLDTEIQYRGEPEFVGIDGTDLFYGVNTSKQVLRWNSNYYMVDEAIWYQSSTPSGPWQIARHRPDGVENIPANNPLHNIKYVYVYKNTEDEVYTGYTSGYTGSYVNGPTVVFGTGFHYHGWHGSFYYHHPMTYGYGIFYDPFYGWGPVYSPWYRPSFHWHWHWRHWYGYRPPYHRPPHHRPPHHRPPRIEHYNASRPVVRPERPTARPEQPINRPGRPSTMPSEPSVRPSQPSTTPGQPGVRPTQPSTRPTQPSVRPSQPSVRPSQPSTRPSQPSVRPSPPVSRPSRPSVRPSAPVSRPSPGPARMR